VLFSHAAIVSPHRLQVKKIVALVDPGAIHPGLGGPIFRWRHSMAIESGHPAPSACTGLDKIDPGAINRLN
jgi:hypothetical protein